MTQPPWPPPAWRPPQQPVPPHQQQPVPQQPVPQQPVPPATGRARVSGWVWPVVCLLALVLGLLGGLAGGAWWTSAHPGSTIISGGDLPTPTVQQAPVKPGDANVVNVAQALLPSTVQIDAEYAGQANGATGSGFVYDAQGHVITNNHVVASAAKDNGPIFVIDHNGHRHKAAVVGRSAVYDIAVLDVAGIGNLKPASLGASAVLRVGEQVVAIGSPLGLAQTVTSGIVSALHRPVTTGDKNSESYINAIQTDAAINPGNSGGPLVDLLGQVVGVNSAIATTGGSSGSGGESGSIGVGFAIPIEQVQVTARQILATGHATYPVIGAKVRTANDAQTGARIISVDSGTPAAQAGMAAGDVVVAVDGQPVGDGIGMIVAIRAHQPGERVVFTVRRGQELRRLTVTLGGETD